LMTATAGTLTLDGGAGTTYSLTSVGVAPSGLVGNMVGTLVANLGGAGGGTLSYTDVTPGGFTLGNIMAGTVVNATGTITPAPLPITGGNETKGLGTHGPRVKRAPR